MTTQTDSVRAYLQDLQTRITTAIDLWTDEGGVLVPSWRTALHDVDGVHAVPPSLPPDPASNEEPS